MRNVAIKIMYAIVITLFVGVHNPSRLYAEAALPSTNLLYLPIAGSWQPVRVDRVEDAEFAVDSLRLWHIIENGGAVGTPVIDTSIIGTPVSCGTQHKVQIHVFDTQGDIGPQSRLNGVIIHILHSDGRTQQEELKATGLAQAGSGIVEFELQTWAEIKVLTNTNGHRISSEAVRVSTASLEIPQTTLLTSGYCQDEADCRRFVSENSCNGAFSWNIVFKRQA